MPKTRLEGRTPDWSWEFTPGTCMKLRAKECVAQVHPRPKYCDRGRWIVYMIDKGYPTNPSPLDQGDAFPRYYFDLDCALREIEAFFTARGYTPMEEDDDQQEP